MECEAKLPASSIDVSGVLQGLQSIQAKLQGKLSEAHAQGNDKMKTSLQRSVHDLAQARELLSEAKNLTLTSVPASAQPVTTSMEEATPSSLLMNKLEIVSNMLQKKSQEMQQRGNEKASSSLQDSCDWVKKAIGYVQMTSAQLGERDTSVEPLRRQKSEAMNVFMNKYGFSEDAEIIQRMEELEQARSSGFDLKTKYTILENELRKEREQVHALTKALMVEEETKSNAMIEKESYIASTNIAVENLTQQLEEAKAEIQTLESAIEEEREFRGSLQKEIKEYRERNMQSREECESLRDTINKLECNANNGELDNVNAKLKETEEISLALREKNNFLILEKDRLIGEVELLNRKLEDMPQLSQLDTQDAKAKISELEAQLQSSSHEFQEKIDSLTREAQADAAKLSVEVTTWKKRAENLRAAIKEMESEKIQSKNEFMASLSEQKQLSDALTCELELLRKATGEQISKQVENQTKDDEEEKKRVDEVLELKRRNSELILEMERFRARSHTALKRVQNRADQLGPLTVECNDAKRRLQELEAEYEAFKKKATSQWVQDVEGKEKALSLCREESEMLGEELATYHQIHWNDRLQMAKQAQVVGEAGAQLSLLQKKHDMELKAREHELRTQECTLEAEMQKKEDLHQKQIAILQEEMARLQNELCTSKDDKKAVEKVLGLEIEGLKEKLFLAAEKHTNDNASTNELLASLMVIREKEAKLHEQVEALQHQVRTLHLSKNELEEKQVHLLNDLQMATKQLSESNRNHATATPELTTMEQAHVVPLELHEGKSTENVSAQQENEAHLSRIRARYDCWTPDIEKALESARKMYDVYEELLQAHFDIQKDCEIPSASPESVDTPGVAFEESLNLSSSKIIVKAGNTFDMPVHVGSSAGVIHVKFAVEEEGSDIGFQMDLMVPNEATKIMEDYQRYQDPFEKKYAVETSGVYGLHWDNTFSWLYPKTLSYTVRVLEPVPSDIQHQRMAMKKSEEVDAREQKTVKIKDELAQSSEELKQQRALFQRHIEALRVEVTWLTTHCKDDVSAGKAEPLQSALERTIQELLAESEHIDVLLQLSSSQHVSSI